MIYLILIAVAFVLLAGFLLLTRYEAAHSVRVMGKARNSLDGRVSRIAFIARHVDFSAFAKDLIRSVLTAFAHDLAHGTLLVIRALERGLTGVVRSLRGERDKDPAKTTVSRAVSFARHAMRSRRVEIQPPSLETSPQNTVE